jgi:hypothetical protein
VTVHLPSYLSIPSIDQEGSDSSGSDRFTNDWNDHSESGDSYVDRDDDDLQP